MTQLTVMLALAAVMFGAHPLEVFQARNATTARDFVVEPATLICLGFEWVIEGDENRNATVTVTYRAAGQSSVEERPSATANRRRKNLPRAVHGAGRVCRQHSRPVTGHRV